MRFVVPQFIERDIKVLGPMSFKQLISLGGAGFVIFLLYLFAPSFVFIVGGFFLAALGFALAFLKFSGRPLPVVLLNVFKFNLESKTYLWKKKEQPIITYKKKVEAILPEKKEEKLPLKIGGESRLKKLHMEIETRTK